MIQKRMKMSIKRDDQSHDFLFSRNVHRKLNSMDKLASPLEHTRMSQTNDSNQAKSAVPFPTMASIPFPYPSGPYPQQAALMDTMLRTLEVLDMEASRAESAEVNKTRHGHVLMLESPTGTGKSLSLACAALAWLRHRESCDLEDVLKPPDHNSQEPCRTTSTQTLGPGYDWLDQWESSEDITRKKDDQQRRELCHKNATSGRAMLQQKLTHIRKQMSSYKDGSSYTNISTQSGYERSRTLFRIQLAKEALQNAAKSMTKWNQRGEQPRRDTCKRKRDEDPSDFCLEEYKSDEDAHPYRDKEDDDYDNDDDSWNREHHYYSLDHTVRSSRHILSGGSLDGSNVSTTFKPKVPHPTSTSATLSQKQYTIGNVKPGQGIRKIIYAARTHSQLSQFISELMKTKWADNVRVVALGSRKMLCGNTNVTGPNRQRSEAYISEKCLDMQKGVKEIKKDIVVSDEESMKKMKTGKSSSCPLLSSKEEVATLALHMLAEPSDIEDLATVGQAVQTCAYYASRESIPAAEVVAIPYSILLSEKARESIGLSLTQNLVLIDEAHNIPEALRGLHSSTLSMEMIDRAFSQISAYLDRYSTRLAGRNLFYIGQIRRFLVCSKKFLQSHDSSSMMSSTEFLFTLKLDNINMFNIVRFLERSCLSRKLLGFNNHSLSVDEGDMLDVKYSNNENGNINQDVPISKHVSCMSLVESFMTTLTFSEVQGKIIAEWPAKDGTGDHRQRFLCQPRFRYVLLNPAAHFKDIVKNAHAVVLTAGTLRPFSHVAQELLSSEKNIVTEAIAADRLCDEERQNISSTFNGSYLTAFTCSHVVPSSNVHLRCISYGNSGTELDFRHNSKYRDDVCDTLAECLVEIFNISPEGVVVFLPSYSYEAYLFRRWKSSGILSAMNQKKTIYREPSSARDLEGILESYSKEARSKKGAALFCVIGGKMSEGINFSDEKARCVIVVGLPYPDINDPVLKEKMKFMNDAPDAVLTGNDYYHSVCMRSLGQAIGRSIRHISDYAAILLVDSRYASDKRIWESLPNWLKNASGKAVTRQPCFDSLLSGLQHFFSSKS